MNNHIQCELTSVDLRAKEQQVKWTANDIRGRRGVLEAESDHGVDEVAGADTLVAAVGLWVWA